MIFLFFFWVLNLGTLEFLPVESRTSLGQPHLVVAAIAVVNIQALVQAMVTGLGIAIETRGTTKKKRLRKITLEDHDMAVTIKRTPSGRVLHALSGKT